MSDTHVFPQPVPLNDEQRIVLLQGDGGLTKRELYTLVATHALIPIMCKVHGFQPTDAVCEATKVADYLLAELEKKGGEK